MLENSLHDGQMVYTAGMPLEKARLAMLMIHGRGATAQDILSLAEFFQAEEPGQGGSTGISFLAPQASGYTWYPQRFTAPLEENEPWLTSALRVISALRAQVEAAGIPPERTLLLGFSQGACLALEWAARNAQRFGGLIGFSGGLIGPDGIPRDYPGSLDGTPVFLGCSDRDPHIPKERVFETAAVLAKLGGEVEARLYPNMGHMVNQDEIEYVRELLKRITGRLSSLPSG
jgi:predicted esterase